MIRRLAPCCCLLALCCLSCGPSDPSEPPPPSAPSSPKAPHLALFAASDFKTKAELAVVNLDSNSVVRIPSDDQDSIVAANAPALLLRTQDTALFFDPLALDSTPASINVAPDQGRANPYGAVVVSQSKAYVVRYGANSLAVVDLKARKITSEIDLSSFVADPDGLVDAFDAVIDRAKNRVYVGLQRIDQTKFGEAPDYAAPCQSASAVVVGIDTLTDSLVDLNGEADGSELEVPAVNPGTLVWNDMTRDLLMLGVGCAEASNPTGPRKGRGVLAVNVDDATSRWLWQSSSLDRPATLLTLADRQLLVGVDDAQASRHWYAFTPPAEPSEELPGLPQLPVVDSDGTLVGVTADNKLQRYTLGGAAPETLVEELFTTKGMFVTSSAMVK